MSLALSEIPKTGFLMTRPIYTCYNRKCFFPGCVRAFRPSTALPCNYKHSSCTKGIFIPFFFLLNNIYIQSKLRPLTLHTSLFTLDVKSCLIFNEISNNVVCETSKVSDQTVHNMHSLIRAFASRFSIL